MQLRPYQQTLHNEVHARPPEPMGLPMALSHVVMVCNAQQRDASHAFHRHRGKAIETGAAQDAVGVELLGFLVPIVAGLAQGLKVADVGEQREVAAVGPDVVNDGADDQAAERFVHAAQRVLRQMLRPRFAPGRRVVEGFVLGHEEKPGLPCGGPGLSGGGAS